MSLKVGVDSDNYMTNLPLYLAIDKGFFKDAGLDDVEVTITGDQFASGLISGSVDVAYAPTLSWFAAGEQSGEDIRWMGPLRGSENLILGVREGIDTPEELKGGKVTGGPAGGDNDANLRTVLDELGLSDEVVEVVPTDPGSDNWLAAVLAGTLDGAAMFPRHVAPLKEAGGTILFQEQRPAPQDGFATTQEAIDARSAALDAFMVGVLKAKAFAADPANREEVFSIMEDNGFDRAVVEDSWDLEVANYTVDGGFAVEDMEAMIQRGAELDLVSADLDWARWVWLDGLWAAQEELGLNQSPAADAVAQP